MYDIKYERNTIQLKNVMYSECFYVQLSFWGWESYQRNGKAIRDLVGLNKWKWKSGRWTTMDGLNIWHKTFFDTGEIIFYLSDISLSRIPHIHRWRMLKMSPSPPKKKSVCSLPNPPHHLHPNSQPAKQTLTNDSYEPNMRVTHTHTKKRPLGNDNSMNLVKILSSVKRFSQHDEWLPLRKL